MNNTTLMARALSIAVFRLNGTLIQLGNHLVMDLDLTSALWQVLDALAEPSTPLSVAHIARNMGLKRQSVQRAVDILAERGMVTFAPNRHHQRAKLVCLTELGEMALASARLRSQRSSELLIEKMGERAITDALDTLNKIDSLLYPLITDPKRQE